MEFRSEELSFWTRHEKWLWGITLLSGGTMVYAARFTMPLCITHIAKEFDWSKTASGTVLSCFFWGYAMTQLIGGHQADQVGGEIVLFYVGIVWTLMTFWMPHFLYLLDFKNNPSVAMVMVIIFRVIYGACQGMHFPATVNIISSNLRPSEKTFFTSIVFAGSSIGIISCGAIGTFILQSLSWQYVFNAIGAISMVWVLFLRFYALEKHTNKVRKVGHSKVFSKQKKVPWLFLLSHKQFWALVIAHFCHANGWFILFSWIPSFFNERFPTAPAWAYSSIPYSVSIFSSVLAGYFAEELIRRKFSVTFIRKCAHSISQVTVALSLIFLGQADDVWAAIFFLCSAVAGSSVAHASTLVNPQDLLPELAGSIFGAMNTAGAIPGFVGVYICGYILETTGSWQISFNLTATCCIFGLLIFLIFGSGKKIELSRHKLLSTSEEDII